MSKPAPIDERAIAKTVSLHRFTRAAAIARYHAEVPAFPWRTPFGDLPLARRIAYAHPEGESE